MWAQALLIPNPCYVMLIRIGKTVIYYTYSINRPKGPITNKLPTYAADLLLTGNEV